jgi:UDP-glucuronate decarboxylase
MYKVLVTGGAGFLGSHLCERLLSLGHQVTCVDNLSTGSITNIKHLQSIQRFSFINHDIVNKINISVDQIYNLACPASPIHYQKSPLDTIKTSIYGAFNVLELGLENNATVLQASTSEVYGDPLVHPQDEKYWGNVNPIGPRACYDESKRCAESIFVSFNKTYQSKIKLVRIFNTYGPRMLVSDGRVVSNFISQALHHSNITIYGSGSQTRSFCYVDDLITALIKMMNSDDSCVGPINIGNPNEISILDIANKIIKLTNSKSKLIFNELPVDDPLRRKPDILKAFKQLGWYPKTNLDNGLSQTINYFKDRPTS